MNVKELRQRLSKHDDNTRVVVYWEGENGEQHLFEIDEISMAQGNADRGPGAGHNSRLIETV
jgi:hypothetical protein